MVGAGFFQQRHGLMMDGWFFSVDNFDCMNCWLMELRYGDAGLYFYHVHPHHNPFINVLLQPGNTVGSNFYRLGKGLVKARRLGVHPVIDRRSSYANSGCHFFYADQSNRVGWHWCVHAVIPCMLAALHSLWSDLNGVAWLLSYQGARCKKKHN